MPLTWLSGRSVASVRSALRQHAPDLSNGNVELRPWLEQSDPKWWYGSADIDRHFFVKFAWSQPAAEKVWHEARILVALGVHPTPFCVPRVVVASESPALLVTEWIAGEPLTIELVRTMDPQQFAHTAHQLARFLADLHGPNVLAAVKQAVGPLDTPLPQATTRAIREGLTPRIRSNQVRQVSRWCDWADGILEVPVEQVFVQGDFHGHNQLWDHDTQTLTAVLDYGESGGGDPAYDFRYLPAQGPTSDLFVATAAEHGKLTGTPIDFARVMAWHIRTVLGDALWRSQAGVPLPDRRTPPEWVDDLQSRLDELDVGDV
jgi:aminoglycoside phosphotransferase (APT) family kinase protein